MIDPDARLCHLASRDCDAVFYPRPGSSDDVTLDDVWQHDTYRVADTDMGGLVIDVGANVGAFTVLAAKLGATVIAVEPVRESRSRMMRHLEANGVEDPVTVTCAAVGPGPGSAVLVDDGGGAASIRTIPGAGPESVPLVTLDGLADEYLPDRQPVAMLKLDAEGAEYGIIAAASDGLLRRVRRIAMEFHGPIQLRARETPGDFGEMVARLAEFFSVEIMGRPSVGGMIWCRSYTVRP